MAAVSKPCPCGSALSYDSCCGPLHAGEPARTPEALMRSRFSAYALGLDAYVLATWHPSTRPARLENEGIEWRRLQIVDTSADVVEFRASYRTPEGTGLLHERSRFVKEGGRWLYIDGEHPPDQR
jgi:SEC-C motif-containing protein